MSQDLNKSIITAVVLGLILLGGFFFLGGFFCGISVSEKVCIAQGKSDTDDPKQDDRKAKNKHGKLLTSLHLMGEDRESTKNSRGITNKTKTSTATKSSPEMGDSGDKTNSEKAAFDLDDLESSSPVVFSKPYEDTPTIDSIASETTADNNTDQEDLHYVGLGNATSDESEEVAILVGNFSDESAKSVLKKLNESGYKTYKQKLSGYEESRTMIMIGPFDGRGKAKEVIIHLRNLGIESAKIVPLK